MSTETNTSPVTISPDELDTAANLIGGALERVEREQGREDAVRAGIKNLHGNTAFLLTRLDVLSVFKLLADLQADVVAAMWEQQYPVDAPKL